MGRIMVLHVAAQVALGPVKPRMVGAWQSAHAAVTDKVSEEEEEGAKATVTKSPVLTTNKALLHV